MKISKFYNSDAPIKDQKALNPKMVPAHITKIVDRALELNDAIVNHGVHSVSDLVKVGSRLGYDELQLRNYLSSNSEFSNGKAMLLGDYSDPVVGTTTTGLLGLVMQEVGTSAQQGSAFDLSFPDMNIPFKNVLLDRMSGPSGMLPEFGGDNAVLSTVQALDSYTLSYESAFYAGRVMFGSEFISFARELGAGNNGLSERGLVQRVAYNMENLMKQTFTRKKFNLAQAIFNNGFTYNGKTISSNIPASNAFVLQPMGVLGANGAVTYAELDPTNPYTPLIAITNVLNSPQFLKYRKAVAGILFNDADLMAIMNHPNVKYVTNFMLANSQGQGLKVKIGDIEREIATYYAPSFEFPLLSDSDTWVASGLLGQQVVANSANADQLTSATQFFIPRGKALVLMDFSKLGDQSQRQLGAQVNTLNQLDPNFEAQAMGIFSGAFPRNLMNSERTGLDLVVSYAGAPAIFMSEAVFTLTGLYQSIL